MMKFASAIATTVTLAVAASNYEVGQGTIRMSAQPVRSQKGGLADTLRNTKFTMDTGNQSYLFTDVSAWFAAPNHSYSQLKEKVDQYQKAQLIQQRTDNKTKFGGANHRLGLNDQVDVAVGYDFLYKLSVYIGESDQEMRVIFDTGSDWLVIEGKDCENCKGGMYDPNTSSYFVEKTTLNRSIEYGSFIHVSGKEVQDQVCLKSFSLCIDPFDFFLVTNQFGISADTDGILGMAQGQTPRGSVLPTDYQVGPLFLDVLSQAQHITEKAFSTKFSGQFGESFIDFGPVDEDQMSNIVDYVEIPMNSGFFWTAIPQGVRFGEKDAYSLNGVDAVFTTGVSLSMVPMSIAEDFFTRMLEGIEAVNDNGVFYVNCATEMTDIWFMFEEHWIEIRGTDLLTDISVAQDNTLCIVNFIPSVDDFWVLGNPIFKDYYVHHNPEKGIMGFVPTVEKFKRPIQPDTVPTTGIEFIYDWELAGVKAGVAAFLMIGAWAMATYLFTKTFAGLSFLNKSSRKTTRGELVERLNTLSTDKLTQMLQAVREKQASNLIE